MINDAGLKLIKEFEGCKLVAYLDKLANPPVWTVGWGDTGPDVKEGTVWTQEQADRRLGLRLEELGRDVLAACVEEPNVNQLAAMASFAYNVGIGAFKKSTLLKKHNAGDFVGAANEFKRWSKAGGEVRAGLTRRRAAEAALYLTPPDDRSQTTRATPEQAPPSKPNTVAIIATVGASLTGAQQAVAQIEGIWGSLHQMGVNPHFLLGLLGLAAVATLGWFVYDAWIRKED